MAVASLPVVADKDHPAVDRFLRALAVTQTVQRTGSAALNLVYVASGRIDVYFSSTLKPWDMAGGAVVVSESGGSVSRIDGLPLDISQPDILASNGSSIPRTTVSIVCLKVFSATFSIWCCFGRSLAYMIDVSSRFSTASTIQRFVGQCTSSERHISPSNGSRFCSLPRPACAVCRW